MLLGAAAGAVSAWFLSLVEAERIITSLALIERGHLDLIDVARRMA